VILKESLITATHYYTHGKLRAYLTVDRRDSRSLL